MVITAEEWNSTHIFYLPGYEHGEIEVKQTISRNEFEIGKTYILSMWIKTGNMRLLPVMGMPVWGPYLTENWIEPDQDWAEYSIMVTMWEENLEEDPLVRILIDWENVAEFGYAWIDEIKLQKVSN